MRFKLVYHPIFENGIVIKERASSSNVYFGKYVGGKELINSYSKIKPFNGVLSDFINNELFEPLFDEFTKIKASKYINKDKIIIENISDHSCVGTIKGTHAYSFKIVIINSHIELTCSCPVRGLCKHLYAVLRYLNSYLKTNDAFINLLNNKEYDQKIVSYIQDFSLSLPKYDFAIFYKLYDYVVNNNSYEELAKIIDKCCFYKAKIIEETLLPSLLCDDKFKAICSNNIKHCPSIQRYHTSFVFRYINDCIINAKLKNLLDGFDKYYGENNNALIIEGIFFYINRNKINQDDYTKLVGSTHGRFIDKYFYDNANKINCATFPFGVLYNKKINKNTFEKYLPFNKFIELIKPCKILSSNILDAIDKYFDFIDKGDYKYIVEYIVLFLSNNIEERLLYDKLLKVLNRIPGTSIFEELLIPYHYPYEHY